MLHVTSSNGKYTIYMCSISTSIRCKYPVSSLVRFCRYKLVQLLIRSRNSGSCIVRLLMLSEYIFSSLTSWFFCFQCFDNIHVCTTNTAPSIFKHVSTWLTVFKTSEQLLAHLVSACMCECVFLSLLPKALFVQINIDSVHRINEPVFFCASPYIVIINRISLSRRWAS